MVSHMLTSRHVKCIHTHNLEFSVHHGMVHRMGRNEPLLQTSALSPCLQPICAFDAQSQSQIRCKQMAAMMSLVGGFNHSEKNTVVSWDYYFQYMEK